jgi:hypothetical protein
MFFPRGFGQQQQGGFGMHPGIVAMLEWLRQYQQNGSPWANARPMGQGPQQPRMPGGPGFTGVPRPMGQGIGYQTRQQYPTGGIGQQVRAQTPAGPGTAPTMPTPTMPGGGIGQDPRPPLPPQAMKRAQPPMPAFGIGRRAGGR